VGHGGAGDSGANEVGRLITDLLTAAGLPDTPELRAQMRDTARVELARQRLLNFTKFTYKRYIADPAHALIAGTLDRVVQGEVTRLMVFAPPQHGKSELVSVRLPAFWFGHHPHGPVILSSYAASLAHSKSRHARDLVESNEYAALFPQVRTDPDKRAVNHWELATPHQGGLVAAGVGGPITGHGAMCFPAGTRVNTEIGALDIKHLVMLQYRPRIWAFDHTSQRLILKRIVTTREIIRGEFIEIITISGRCIRATPEHPIYVQGRGYRPAALLSPGEKLIGAVSLQQGMQDLRATKNWPWSNVSILLPKVSQHQSGINLCMVWKSIRATIIQAQESVRAWLHRCLLQSRLCREPSRSKEREEMCSVWPTDARTKDPQILLTRMPRVSTAQTYDNLWMVRDRISGEKQSNPVLLTGLCQCRTLNQNARKGQLPLQEWNKLREMVRGNATINSRTGRSQMRDLSNSGKDAASQMARANGRSLEFGNTSYQRRPIEQLSRKFDNSLSIVSPKAPQFEEDTVALVRHIRTGDVRVYDLQVEGCRNFFAEGILVHNCGIIDDPFENWEQAQSQVIRDKVWEWWRGTFRTRVWEDGAIILIMTRWHEDDLAGRLLAEQGDRWTVLRLPALAETQEDRDQRNKKMGLAEGQADPLGRAPGEALCPSRFSVAALAGIRADVGSLVWACEYQGAPTQPEGNRFKRAWFPIVDAAPARAKRGRYWDLAATEGGGKRTAGVQMAVAGRDIYIEDVTVGQWASGRRNKTMRQTAELDEIRLGHKTPIWVEQEPGSSGVDAIKAIIGFMAGFPIHADRPTGNKDVRLEPFAAQAEAGNVRLVRGKWNAGYIEEMCAVPNGKFRDQADATAGAYARLVRGGWSRGPGK